MVILEKGRENKRPLNRRNKFFYFLLGFSLGLSCTNIYNQPTIKGTSSTALNPAKNPVTRKVPRVEEFIIKTKGGTEKTTWELVDWENPRLFSFEEESGFDCTWTTFISSISGKKEPMCVHTSGDIHVSQDIKRVGRWKDCDILPRLWAAEGHDDGDSLYLEIGANIGSCVMEMLLETNAKIIAFEPHPMNIHKIKKTVSKLDKSFQDRLSLFPVGLGAVQGNFTIYSAFENMGNSVIGKVIKDNPKQVFDEKLQFTINVERLESILAPKNGTRIKLVKMDVQGFECNVMEGMGEKVAKLTDVVKFEYEPGKLDGHGCLDLVERFRKFGFKVFKHFENGHLNDEVDQSSIQGGEWIASRKKDIASEM